MDSFELNKILGAVLATCLGVLSINIAAGAIFAPGKPAKPGYDIAVPETGSERCSQTRGGQAGADRATARQGRGWPGENSAKKCAACHTFNKGGRPLVGPNLWGVVGRPKASEAGFNYSAALKAKGGNWSIDDLNQFINNPRGYVPGTNMTFAGISRGSERADVISYLNTLSDNPAPLPKAAEATGAPEGAVIPIRRPGSRRRPDVRLPQFRRPSRLVSRACQSRAARTLSFCNERARARWFRGAGAIAVLAIK